MSTLTEVIVLFLFSLVLFIIAIVADRMLNIETPAKWSFVLSLFSLFLSLLFLISNFVVGMPPVEVTNRFIDFMNWLASEYGGWSVFIGVNYLCLGTATGLMALLAPFVVAVDAEGFGLLAITTVLIGIIFLTGFFDFFKALSLILGIVATIIGILVGFKKLATKN